MSRLGPDARALIEAARGAGEPDRAALLRVRRSVLRRAAAGATACAGVGTTSKVASASVGMATMAKGIAALAVAGALAGGIYAARTPKVAPSIPASVGPSAPPPAVTSSSSLPPDVAPPPIVPSASPRPPQSLIRPQPSHAPSAPAEAPASLASDVARLREARSALNAGDARAALAILDQVPERGALAEEREGLRVIAQCRME